MGRASVVGERAEQILALRAAGRTVLDPEARAGIEGVERLLREELGESIPKRRAAALLKTSVTTLDKWIGRDAIPVVRRERSSRVELESETVLRLAELARRPDARGLGDALERLAERRVSERQIVEVAKLSKALTSIAAARPPSRR